MFQKLLWAVSEVLKSCGIHSHHKQFRSFLQQLFKVCSKQWLQTSCTEVKTSTSEAMRALVMKHKSTVLKLKLTSPKNDTTNKDNLECKKKSVADVKKVLFTEPTPKSDFKPEKFSSDLEIKGLPLKNTVINKKVNDIAVFIDIKRSPANNETEGKLNTSVPSTINYCSVINIESKDSEAIFSC